MAQVHHSTQKGMAVFALEWCYQKLRDSSRSDYKFKMLTWGVLVGVITCVGVWVFLVIRPHAYFALVLLYLLVT